MEDWNLNVTSPKEAQKELKNHGFELQRVSGDHMIYSNGTMSISVVRHNRRFSKYTWRDSLRRMHQQYANY